MILDNTHLTDNIDNHATHRLPENIDRVCVLQIEARDTLPTILDVLRHQKLPVLLLLPDVGDAFSQSEHFIALRSLLAEKEHPPFLCLVIPSQRATHATEADFADSYGIQHVSSMEEAIELLLHASASIAIDHADLPDALDALDASAITANVTPALHHVRTGRVTEDLRKVKTTAPLPVSTAVPKSPVPRSKKQPYLLGIGFVALLLAATTLFVPLFFIPTHLPHPPRPQAGAAATPPGMLAFTSSGQYNDAYTEGYNDMMTLSLHHIAPPPAGMSYYAWLMPDPGDDTVPPLLIGTLHVGAASLTYTSPSHANLLANYSGVRITVQPSGTIPDSPSQDPTAWRWQGFIPNTPMSNDANHYSFLSHVRHLLAKDPTLQANQMPGGLDLWLTRNVSKVEEWTSAAQGDWHGEHTSQGNAAQIHNHMLRILAYLDGKAYYLRDVPPGSPWLVDPQAGKLGLLNSVPNQDPPGFLTHVDIHLAGLAESPGHTDQQQKLAIAIDKIINRMRGDLQQVHADAVKLVKMNTQQLRQTANGATLDEMLTLTTEVQAGWFDPGTGENIGGVLWIASRLQQLAATSVSESNQRQ